MSWFSSQNKIHPLNEIEDGCEKGKANEKETHSINQGENSVFNNPKSIPKMV